MLILTSSGRMPKSTSGPGKTTIGRDLTKWLCMGDGDAYCECRQPILAPWTAITRKPTAGSDVLSGGIKVA